MPADPLSYLDKIDGKKPIEGGDEIINAVELAVDELEAVEDSIYQAEKTLNMLKARRDLINKKYIPALLTQLGVTIVDTLNKGYKVTIKRYLYVKIKNKEELEKFLDSRGDSALMDTVVRIKKLTAGARRALKKVISEELKGVVQKQDYTLHHSTQRSYFNKLLTQNPELIGKVEQFGEVKEYHDTKVVRGVQ